MGVDMQATVEVRYRDEYGEPETAFTPVCEVWCGRWYHWAEYLAADDGPRTLRFKTLRRVRHRPIFDGKVTDTPLYVIMAALADRHGRKHVRLTWEAR